MGVDECLRWAFDAFVKIFGGEVSGWWVGLKTTFVKLGKKSQN